MRHHHRWAVVGGATALLVAVVAAHLVEHHAPVPEPVSFADGMVFTPRAIPTGAKYVSADKAWMAWEAGQHLTPDITTEFGMLDGGGQHQLAWGFSQRGCVVPSGFPSAQQLALVSSPKCRHWTFVNPTTGEVILGTDLYPTTP